VEAKLWALIDRDSFYLSEFFDRIWPANPWPFFPTTMVAFF
jgi:hypothetical protein